jgi:hypothetical protein
MRTASGANELERFEFISSILHTIVSYFAPDVYANLQWRLCGPRGRGRPDFTIRYREDFFCVTEAKPSEIEKGIWQNMVELDIACSVSI